MGKTFSVNLPDEMITYIKSKGIPAGLFVKALIANDMVNPMDNDEITRMVGKSTLIGLGHSLEISKRDSVSKSVKVEPITVKEEKIEKTVMESEEAIAGPPMETPVEIKKKPAARSKGRTQLDDGLPY